MKIILNDVNDSDKTVTLNESERGNVVIGIRVWPDEEHKVIVKPDDLFRAARLFVADQEPRP